MKNECLKLIGADKPKKQRLAYKRRDELEAELEELKSRKCENCNSFEIKSGIQPDTPPWETMECLNGVWVQPMEIDTMKILCSEWEKKDD